MGSMVLSLGGGRRRGLVRDMSPVSVIGAAGLNAAAMRVRKADLQDGSWVYEQEIPLHFSPVTRSAGRGQDAVSILRLEFKSIESPARLVAGDQLIMAVYPAGTTVIGNAPFKRPLPENDGAPLAQAAWGATGFEPWLDAFAYDPWETQGRLTASVTPKPMRPDTDWALTRGDQRCALGICPGAVPIEEIVADIAKSDRLRAAADAPPELIELSILQALAGPIADSMQFLAKTVAERAVSLLRDHTARLDTAG